MAYSAQYETALRLATKEHRHQDRKGTDIPYITHPVHVSVILARYGFPEPVMIAALLHDVVEDQDYSLQRIEETFGLDVAEMVAALSEQKRDQRGNVRAWDARKREALERLGRASTGAVAIKAADVLHNTRALVADLRREGPGVWDRFNGDPESSLQYYRDIASVARERLGDHPLVAELETSLDDLELIINGPNSGEQETWS
jgi:(p)ppGpp synthase/HD superfamily hydrolase